MDTKRHAVTPTTGFRLSLVYFNSKSLRKLSLDDWQQLEYLQLPCSSTRARCGGRSTAAGANFQADDNNPKEPIAGSGKAQ
eukprot:2321930-Prorocentrum_lima.AAC.1